MPSRVVLADSIQPKFGYPWTELPSDEEAKHFTTEQLVQLMEEWKAIDDQGKRNPVGAGWTLPSWRAVMAGWKKANIHVMCGGNQSAKSTFGARLTLSVAAAIPEASCACLSMSAESSEQDQQKMVYEALPESLQNLPTQKGKHYQLGYTQRGGFTNNLAILPPLPGYRRGSSIHFFNYNQFQADDQFLEGKRFHFVWADEKIPLALLNTLRLGRIGTYHGRILLTYTVIDGWNDTVEKIMARTKTLESRYCDHPKIKAKLPILQESLSMDSCRIYFAWTAENPFVDYSEFMRLNASEPRDVILARGYGVPTKSTTSAFPLFNKDVNVVRHEDLPWLKPPKKNARGADIVYKITRYMGLDPAGSKSWAMGWVAIDSGGTWWIYDEWPNVAIGEWALSGDKAGPAQKGTGKGIKDYVEIIKQIEDGTQIFERVIDPRLGNAEKQGQDGAVTLISDLDENDLTFIPAPAASSEVNKV